MRRRIYIAAFVLVVLFSFQIVDAGEPLKLSGKIVNIEMEDKNDRVVFHLIFNLSFTNTGDKPILLLTAGYPESSPYAPQNGFPFLGICSKISGVLETEKTEKVLSSGCALPSIEGTSGWQILSKELDSKTPPSNLIKILKSGETLDFKTPGAISFFKKRELYSSFADEAIWSEIKNAKSLSLQTTYRIWSLELEPRSKNREQKLFGKKLQNRWSQYGYLPIDDIVSEPILLDLSSAVVKTASQP